MIRNWLHQALAVSDAGVRYHAGQGAGALEAYRRELEALAERVAQELAGLPPPEPDPEPEERAVGFQGVYRDGHQPPAADEGAEKGGAP